MRLTSRGPAIYTSFRVGKDGKAFKMWKLRSMSADAEEQREALLEDDEMPRKL